MNRLKVIIVEDEPLAAEGLKSYIRELDFLELVAYCENALEANKVLSEQKIDLLFLDIQMPKLTGIEFLQSVKSPPLVIFTTAYPNYALKGFELDAVDYLVKPYPFDRFFKAVNKARDTHQLKMGRSSGGEPKRPPYFFVKADKKLEKVELDKIFYVEAMENYVIIHLEGQKIITMMTMKNMEDHLPQTQFLRIHKSFIVNKFKVDAIEGNLVRVNRKGLPVSRQNRQEVLSKIINK